MRSFAILASRGFAGLLAATVCAMPLSGCVGSSEEDSESGNSEAVRISFNTGTELLVNDDETDPTYEQPFTLIVTDKDGAPVEGAKVEMSVRPLFYFKGRYVPVDTTGDGMDDAWGTGYDSNGDGTIDVDQGATGRRFNTFRCQAEDQNFNGSLDPGEDNDGDGSLEPSTDATISPATLETDSDGTANFSLKYPQGNGRWSTVEIRARADVQGTEELETREQFLNVLAEDVGDVGIQPPGGVEAPYGEVGDCTDPS